MSEQENLRRYISELIQEVEKELEEATTTGNVDGYQTPHAFSRKKDKERTRKNATQLGYELVDDDVDNISEAIKKITSSQYKKLEDAIKKINPKIKISPESDAPGGFEIKIPDDNKWELHTHKVQQLITKITGDHRNGRIFFEGIVNEAGLKGTENIPSNKKLSKLSDNEKLNILQSGGNIISFHIPDWAKGRYNKWQVISAGKIKKNKDLDGEIIYFLPGKGPQKSSPTYPTLKDLINGVDWETMEMRRESVNESPDDKQKVVDYLVKKGNNKNDAQKMVDKNYDFVSKRYKGASVVKKAEIISGLQEAITEARIKRPVNRWLELKNDETMHPHKKMAHGLKELKYQLAETEKFFKWYNRIKTMNELDSTNYWKRTQNHIYKIKERLINIAKTLQEIEK